MKKSFLSFTICNLLISTPSYAIEQLDTILVTTATKTARNIEGVAASVVVVTGEDIEKIGAESLKDIVRQIPGLNIQYGTFPSASSTSKSSISIRGMSANGTLFLIDGRRLSGEVANPYDLDRIPASIIERIEVVKGPMSSLYGADAVGGVINIITKQPGDKPETDISIRYGSNDHGEADNANFSLSTRGKKSALGYSFYVNQTKTEPYTQTEQADVYKKTPMGNKKPSSPFPPNTGTLQDNYDVDVTYREKSDILTFGGRLDYDINNKHRLGFEFNKMIEERDGTYIGYFHPSNYNLGPNKVPVFNTPINSEDDNDRFDWGLDLTSDLNDSLTTKLRFYNSYYKKRNTTTSDAWQDLGYSSEKTSAQNGMNANVDIKSIEAIATYAVNESHLVTAGLEKRDEEREATVFDSTPNMSRKTVDYKAVYLQDEWQIAHDLNVVMGARYDRISNADNKSTYRIGMVKNFNKLTNLRLNFAQGYRTPDIRELYINKDTPSGKQRGAEVFGYDLKPEFINAYEIGLNGSNQKFSYSTALFYNDIEDRIEDNVLKPGGIRTFENIDNAVTKGLEVSLGYEFTSQISSSIAWTELRTEDKSTGKDLQFNPERSINVKLDYQPMPNLLLGLNANYIGEQYYVETLNRGAPTESTKDSTANTYTLVNLTSSYQINESVEIYGGINNIADKDVDDILGSDVGRFIFAGARFKL